MVKIPNRPPTPIVPRNPDGPPPHLCPDLLIELPVETEATVRAGDAISVQIRDGRVRVLCQGQVIGWVSAPEIVEAIRACQEAGATYRGSVASLDGGTAVVTLEGRRR